MTSSLTTTGIIPLKDTYMYNNIYSIIDSDNIVLTIPLLVNITILIQYRSTYTKVWNYHIMKFSQVCNTHSFFYHGDNDD